MNIDIDTNDINIQMCSNVLMNTFEQIYKNKGWGFANNETLSGGGSTKEINKYRNIFLTDFINENNINTVYDICGDCNWQYDFVKNVIINDFKYYGFDISEYALNKAKENNKNNSLTFSNNPIDLCKDLLQFHDNSNSLIIIKEVIQHLPLGLGLMMLTNIKKSGIKYIAITNHDADLFNVKSNINVNIGEFYPNNMFIEPFNFKNPLKNVNDIIDDKNDLIGYGNLIIFNIQEQNIYTNEDST
jgi:hypothetical protein